MARQGAYLDKEDFEKSIELDYVPVERPKTVSTWLRIGLWGLFMLVVASDLIPGNFAADASSQLSTLQIVIMAVFAAIFSTICAYLASRINKNLDFAWAIGFLFGLVGFLVYLGYFSIIRVRHAGAKAKKDGAAKPRKRPKK